MAWLKYLKVREVSLVDKAANPEARILFHKHDAVSVAQYFELAKGWLEESFDSIFADPDLSPRQTMDALLLTGREFVDEVVKFVPETQARDEFRTLLSKSYNKKKPKNGKPTNTAASSDDELKLKPGDDPAEDEHDKSPTNTNRKNMSKNATKPLADVFIDYVKRHMIPNDKGDIVTASDRLYREDPFAKMLFRDARAEAPSAPVKKEWSPRESQVGDVLKNKMDEIQKKYPRKTRDEAFDAAIRENGALLKRLRQQTKENVR